MELIQLVLTCMHFFHFRDFDNVLQQKYGLYKIRIMSHLAHYSNFVLSMLL